MAVVRLKRKLSEEPVEAFLLSCKKKRDENTADIENKSEVAAVVKFAGTVQNQDDSISHISKVVKKDKSLLLTHQSDVIGKFRAETRNNSQQNRFKVVNCFRALEGSYENDSIDSADGATNSDSNTTKLTVLDIVSNNDSHINTENTTESKEVEDEPSEEYVYDLYYGAGDVDDLMMETLVSVQPIHLHALYYRTGDTDDSDAEDSEDSNAENYWRNDYPDSDHSIDEDDMRLAAGMDCCDLDNGLSSDEEDEKLVYEDGVDAEDLQLYGASYANYKARVSRDLYSGYFVQSSASEDENDDYCTRDYDEDDDNDPALRFQ